MKLCEFLELEKGTILSVVGAGGKTSLINQIADELRYEGKVLVATTTKIYYPSEDSYDFISIAGENIETYKNSNEKGVYVFGESIVEGNKIKGLDKEKVDELAPFFDYILIEADGSRQKDVKGWGEHEPVIPSKTNKTLGVVSVDAIGMEINDENIHRVDEFCTLTGKKNGDKISIMDMKNLVFSEYGLFKSSLGDRILFINKVDDRHKNVVASELEGCILRENRGFIREIIVGSIKNQTFFPGSRRLKGV